MDTKPNSHLPVAILGAGPVGLAAAAHLLERGLEPLVFEAGDGPGSHVTEWGHVRLFSPWRYSIDAAARRLLERDGWEEPDPFGHPTGGELVDRYLRPLAALPELAPRIRYGTRVEAVTRQGHDRMRSAGRAEAPFAVHVRSAAREEVVLARAVIDASGTWASPNPLGAGGVPAPGERRLAERVFYGIPDVLGRHRESHAGRATLVVGSGHSAFNTLIDLARLALAEPGTRVVWAIRRPTTEGLFGGGGSDQLPARGALGEAMRELVGGGAVELVTGFTIQALSADPDDRVRVEGAGAAITGIDRIVATTGARPDLSLLRELRVDLDETVESPRALAPLIDPNVHSCGTVPPHGARELSHPEEDFYIAGVKSYGRAPTFLLLTGYEQVRSIAAALAGDVEAAARVELQLPETGVCSTDGSASPGGLCRTA